MHRIDAARNSAGSFVDVPTPGTRVDAAWLNAVQEELANVIAFAGAALNKASHTQVIEAINQLDLASRNLVLAAIGARIIGTAGLATGGGDLSADRTINVPKASRAEAVAGVDDTKAVTPYALAGAIAALVNGAPGALDTLKELADALGDDANFASSVTSSLAGKVATGRQVVGGGLATGGGALTADLTITVPAAIGTDVAAGASTTKAATPKAIADALATRGGGTISFPDGTILQRGVVVGPFGEGAHTAAFPAAFPNAVDAVVLTPLGRASGRGPAAIMEWDDSTTTTAVLHMYLVGATGDFSSSPGFSYIAYGH